MTETLFTDILERIRPGYKSGGVITTPKRGLVNEAGSYAGESPLGTTEEVKALYKKIAQEYDQVLQTAVNNRDFRNVPEFKEWAIKNYGPTFEKKHYRKNVTRLSKLKYYDTQSKLLDTLIDEANQGLKYKSFTDLQQQAGYSKKTGMAAGKGSTKYGRLDTAADKMKKGFDYLYGNPDKPVSEMFDSFKQLRKITGLNVEPSKYLKGYAPYEENKRVIKNLSTTLSKQRLARNPDLTLGELQFRVQNRVKDTDLFKPPRSVNMETKIMDIANRHVKQGGKKIKWLTKPGKTELGYPDYSKARFKYKGQTYDLSRLIQSADVDPNFKEFFQVEDQIKALNAKEVIHPKTKKPVRFDDLMRETYGYKNRMAPYAVDHFKQVADEPFTNLRIIPARVNAAAGTTKQFGEEFITDPRKKQKYTKVGKEKILKKIGYNYQKPFDQLVRDELKLAEDVLVRGRKLRSPAAIVDELYFSETPTTNIKPKVSTQPTLSSDTFGVRTAIEEGPGAVKKLGSLGARGAGKALLSVGSKALLPLGLAVEGYFMNEARKQGKTAAEILAMPFMLEGRVAEAQDMLKLTPVERQAYNRANIEQDDSLLDTDFYTPDLEGIETIDNEASKKYLRQSRALEEALRAQERAAPKQRFTLPNITGIIEDEV